MALSNVFVFPSIYLFFCKIVSLYISYYISLSLVLARSLSCLFLHSKLYLFELSFIESFLSFFFLLIRTIIIKTLLFFRHLCFCSCFKIFVDPPVLSFSLSLYLSVYLYLCLSVSPSSSIYYCRCGWLIG